MRCGGAAGRCRGDGGRKAPAFWGGNGIGFNMILATRHGVSQQASLARSRSRRSSHPHRHHGGGLLLWLNLILVMVVVAAPWLPVVVVCVCGMGSASDSDLIGHGPLSASAAARLLSARLPACYVLLSCGHPTSPIKAHQHPSARPIDPTGGRGAQGGVGGGASNRAAGVSLAEGARPGGPQQQRHRLRQTAASSCARPSCRHRDPYSPRLAAAAAVASDPP